MLSSVTAGDGSEDAAFSTFFLESLQRVAGVVALALGDAETAEDATQEAFIRARARWSRVGGLERPDLWVVRVAVNRGRDMRRGRARERRRLELVGVGAQTEAASELIRSLWLQWGLAQLPPRQRAAVVLHHLEERPIDEVARALDRSSETVRTHLKLGRRRLRLLLQESM
jgi:RNA polymerase sigma-70 factor (ECF subfamily)